MTDERNQPPELIATGFAALVDGVHRAISDLRDDFREDSRELESRMTAQIQTIGQRQAETHQLVVDFAKGHGEQHEAEDADRRHAHGEFYAFIRARELDEARRDGALGVVRYGVELVSKHAGRLVQVILATAALLGIATGSIEVGVR